MMTTAVITGATEGIGLATAFGLARRRAIERLIIVGRDLDKGKRVVSNFVKEFGSSIEIEFISADLSLMAEARRLANEIQSRVTEVRYLVHSAGAMPGTRRITNEGEDASFVINYLSRFVLTETLFPQLRASAQSRVVIVGSAMPKGRIDFHDTTLEGRWTMMRALKQFQKANQVYVAESERRLKGFGITINLTDPGIVNTRIRRESALFRVLEPFVRPFMHTPERAADDVMSLLLDSRFEGCSGDTYSGAKLVNRHPLVFDGALGAKLYYFSMDRALKAERSCSYFPLT